VTYSIFAFLSELATIWETTLLIFPKLLGLRPQTLTETLPLDPAGGLPPDPLVCPSPTLAV